MSAKYFAEYSGETYDRLQPIKIEHYAFYHQLALDFVPFGTDDSFRFMDLGCGTGNFLTSVLEKYPKSTCLAYDYTDEMLEYVSHKNNDRTDRIALRQRDLNEGLPENIGTFSLISAFSAIHHLTDENKQRILKQIYDCLNPGGWFFLIDPMIVHFDDQVWQQGRGRNKRRQQERYALAGLSASDYSTLIEPKAALAEDSPEKDRHARLDQHLVWLEEAGFKSVDHIWHYWMEHFIIARK